MQLNVVPSEFIVGKLHALFACRSFYCLFMFNSSYADLIF